MYLQKFYLLSFFVITACTSSNTLDFSANAPENSPRHVLMFLDGTDNDHNSRTNVGRLFALAENQKREDLLIFYTSGVGADSSSVVGMATGFGTAGDVQQAYIFLSENRRQHDLIHLYGYSRGAWSARILAGFIYVTGLVEWGSETESERKKIVRELYRAFKGQALPITERKKRVDAVAHRYGLRRNMDVRIAILGLWDTIEALGVTHFKEKVVPENQRYVDQVCNVGRSFHAVALDDNRASVYTPILMDRRRLIQPCAETDKPGTIEEVWFAGAHGDLGGSYVTQRNPVNGQFTGYISGVSLNWMLASIRDALPNNVPFPKEAAVHANPYDIIHDGLKMLGGLRHTNLIPEGFRDLERYRRDHTEGAVLKVHNSVADRFLEGAPLVEPINDQHDENPTFVNTLAGPGYALLNHFPNCFSEGKTQTCPEIKFVANP